MTLSAKLLEEMRDRRDKALSGGGEDKIKTRHKKGLMTARERLAAYRAEFALPYLSASRGYITDVIDPAVTRSTVALALRKSLTKREIRPPKKHGNIPL